MKTKIMQPTWLNTISPLHPWAPNLWTQPTEDQKGKLIHTERVDVALVTTQPVDTACQHLPGVYVL